MNAYPNRAGDQQAGTPQPQQPLPGALGGMTYSITKLEEVAAILRDRLGAVLTPQPPQPTGKSDNALTTAPPPVSDMTGNVAAQSRRIDMIAMGLGDVLNRLEV